MCGELIMQNYFTAEYISLCPGYWRAEFTFALMELFNLLFEAKMLKWLKVFDAMPLI